MHRPFFAITTSGCYAQTQNRPLLLAVIEFDVFWIDFSPAARKKNQADIVEFERRVQALSRERMSHSQTLSLRLLAYSLAQRREGQLLGLYFVVNHYRGIHLRIVDAMRFSLAENVRDYERQLMRLRGIPSMIDSAIAAADESLERQITPSGVVVDQVITAIARQLSLPAGTSPLLVHFRSFPSSLSEADRARLAGQARMIYEREVRPAFVRYRHYLVSRYAPAAASSIGLSGLADGKEL